jgi:hypothetical protein
MVRRFVDRLREAIRFAENVARIYDELCNRLPRRQMDEVVKLRHSGNPWRDDVDEYCGDDGNLGRELDEVFNHGSSPFGAMLLQSRSWELRRGSWYTGLNVVHDTVRKRPISALNINSSHLAWCFSLG